MSLAVNLCINCSFFYIYIDSVDFSYFAKYNVHRDRIKFVFDPLTLQSAEAIIVPHRIMKLVHWPLMAVTFGTTRRRLGGHPSTASVPVAV